MDSVSSGTASKGVQLEQSIRDRSYPMSAPVPFFAKLDPRVQCKARTRAYIAHASEKGKDRKDDLGSSRVVL